MRTRGQALFLIISNEQEIFCKNSNYISCSYLETITERIEKEYKRFGYRSVNVFKTCRKY